MPPGLTTLFLVLGLAETALFVAVYLYLRLARVRDLRWTVGIVAAAALIYLGTFAAMLVAALRAP